MKLPKGIILFVIATSIAMMTWFIYLHPHIPITLSDATTIQAYRIKTKNQIKMAWVSSYYEGKPEIDYNSPSLGKKLTPYTYIVGNPVQCGKSTQDQLERLLANPETYLVNRNSRSEMNAHFAFHLSGTSGVLLVFVDPDTCWIDIQKFDPFGKLVADSGAVDYVHNDAHTRAGWERLLKQTFPEIQID